MHSVVLSWADGMVGESIITAIGSDLNGAIATLPGGSSGAEAFVKYANANGVSATDPSYPNPTTPLL